MSFSGATTAASPARAEDVHIDFMLPLTGPQARLGHVLQRAAALALMDLNGARSSASRSYRARYHDDGCSLAGGKKLATELSTLTPPVRAVIGVPCEAVLDGLVSSSSGLSPVVVLTTARLKANSQSAGRRTGNVFSLYAPSSPGRALAAVLSELQPTARVAFVRDKTHYAVSLVQDALAVLEQSGRKPVAVEIISGGDKEFGAIAQRISAADATHVVVVAFPVEAGLLVGDLVSVMPTVEIIGSDTLAVPAFGKALGRHARNVRVFVEAQPHMATAAQALGARFRAAGIPVSRHTIGIYAAVELWAAATTVAGTVEAEAISREIRSRPHRTASGVHAFDRDGTGARFQSGLHHWMDGRWSPLEAGNGPDQRP
ncbi:MAG TPA: ABC transporter substrate-binding protein [Hyphomicrobiaceae bacterium]|nr:ABC transporter substrate-binding protein [Hyphomicrobiaceae bacterium]